MADLEAKLASEQRQSETDRDRRLLLDGRTIAELKSICDLADKYGALVMIDDAHATGFLAREGVARMNTAMSW